MRDGPPRWTRHLQARSRHIGWAVGGFLGGGVLTEYLTQDRWPALVGLACSGGAAWGYRQAGRPDGRHPDGRPSGGRPSGRR